MEAVILVNLLPRTQVEIRLSLIIERISKGYQTVINRFLVCAPAGEGLKLFRFCGFLGFWGLGFQIDIYVQLLQADGGELVDCREISPGQESGLGFRV